MAGIVGQLKSTIKDGRYKEEYVPEHPKYDPSLIGALFWSEIANGHLLWSLFDRHKDIAKSFIQKFIGIDPERVDIDKLRVRKDKNYPGKGRVDVFLWIPQDFCVLLEIKVHDFKSAKPTQLADYYEAGLNNARVTGFKDVFLIYLTQFSKQNFQTKNEKLHPKSFRGFENLQSQFPDFKDKTAHINWIEFHEFMSPHLNKLNEEESRLLEMQRQWIENKEMIDKEKFGENRWKRDLSFFLEDIDLSWVTSFVPHYRRGKRIVIPLDEIPESDLKRFTQQIEGIFESDSINQVELKQEEDAVEAEKRIIEGVQNENNNAALLFFYKNLFSLIHERRYLEMKLGRSGRLMVNAKIHHKGKANLLVLSCHGKNIEFSIRDKNSIERGPS